MVLPDNVLFEDGRGKALRQKMMRECRVHTILRLPTGIFYAQGVKTNVVFLQKSEKPESVLVRQKQDETDAVWVYDLRAQMPQFGKTNSFGDEHLKGFVAAYGDEPNGLARRRDRGGEGRFRRFTREEIKERGDSLDINWLRDSGELDEEALTDPAEIATAIIGHLQSALDEIQALQDLLANGEAA